MPDKPGVAARIFKAIGDATVNVDMIVQNISHGTGTPATDISFTVDKPDLLKAQKVIDGLKAGNRLRARSSPPTKSASCPSSASA